MSISSFITNPRLIQVVYRVKDLHFLFRSKRRRFLQGRRRGEDQDLVDRSPRGSRGSLTAISSWRCACAEMRASGRASVRRSVHTEKRTRTSVQYRRASRWRDRLYSHVPRIIFLQEISLIATETGDRNFRCDRRAKEALRAH